MMPTTQVFRDRINENLKAAEVLGKHHADMQSGSIHRQVGGYPGPNHRMPECCNAMREYMKQGDEILHKSPKGHGATLKIRYILPR